MIAHEPIILAFLVGLYLLVSLFVYFKIKKYEVSGPFLVCVLVKLGLCIAGVFVALPFTGKDSMNFQNRAVQWSSLSVPDIFLTIDITKSYVISSLVAFLYKAMEPFVAIPIFMNGIIGVLMFYYAIKLSYEIWRARPGWFFAIIIATHAMLNVHSAIFLRENLIGLLILLSAYYLAKYANGEKGALYPYLAFCILASFFHGGMLIFILGLPIYLVIYNGRMSFLKKVLVSALVGGLAFISLQYMNINKIDTFVENGIDVETIVRIEEGRQEAGTAYLTNLKPSHVYDIFWQAPIRIFYLLFKPFPWDVSSIGHVLVFFDALLWMYTFALIVKNRKSIKNNPAALVVLISCIIAIAAFAYGTGNYGTGVRHRTKFFIMIFALVSPFLPQIRFGPYSGRRTE